MTPPRRQPPTTTTNQPHTGNQTRYRVITTAEETGGESFTIELLIREGAWGSDRKRPGSQPGHYHIHQDEHIEVKKGKLGYWRGHPDLAAEAGPEDDDVIIQPGERGGGRERDRACYVWSPWWQEGGGEGACCSAMQTGGARRAWIHQHTHNDNAAASPLLPVKNNTHKTQARRTRSGMRAVQAAATCCSRSRCGRRGAARRCTRRSRVCMGCVCAWGLAAWMHWLHGGRMIWAA